jgi:transposase
MNKKYVVRLESSERLDLERLVSCGKGAARKLTHARILLQADVSAAGLGWKDEQISNSLGVTTRTVEHVRRRCVEEGLEAALNPKKREHPPVPRKLDGAKEAKLVAICCSQPPEGFARWTLKLLADRMVKLEIVESVSRDTVRRTLQKTS